MQHTPDLSTRPTRVVRDAERRTLRIPWADGHESSYDWEYLRRSCPCAHCQGEWGRPGSLGPNTLLTVEQTFLRTLQLVGRYALQPTWGDGHDTGIFAFSHLRELCPCAECRGAANP